MDKHFERVERNLGLLLASVAGIFTEPEKQEVQEYIDFGEYGIALELAIGTISEKAYEVNDETNSLIEHLIELMDMHDSCIVKEYKNERRKD